MTITDITSYDVLADPPTEGIIGEYQLDKYKKNIGNNRLKIFLALYQSNYDRESRRENNADCNSIVNDVLNTLYERCVPTGRFLINASKNLNKLNCGNSNGNGYDNTNSNDGTIASASTSTSTNDDGTAYPPVWNIMKEEEAKELIHAILKGVSPPDQYKQQQQQQLQQQQGVKEVPLNPNLHLNSAKKEKNITNNNNNNHQEEHKRRRRPSLLRRSASDSLLDDSKKVTRFDRQQQQRLHHRKVKEEPAWSSSSSIQKDGTVTLNRMDVILTSSMDALDPNCRSIGNNRLHILVAMQSGKYQQATVETRETILHEVIQTVNTFWKGRFLTESSDGYYEILDKADAKESLRLIFDTRSGQNLFSSTSATTSTSDNHININKIPIADPAHSNEFVNNHTNSSKSAKYLGGGTRPDAFTLNSNMAMRHASTSAIPSGNTGIISNDTKHVLSRHISTSFLPTPSKQSSSLDRMEPPVGLSDIEDLRSAAVKSLQKQKARQKIANRLEKVSMTRSSDFSNSSISNNSSTSTFSNNFNNNNSNNNTDNLPSSSSLPVGGIRSGIAKRRQSSIFGALDPTVMDEIIGSCFDDEDSIKK